MQSLNSLYFPQTTLPRHLRHCLLLLPDSLHLLQPIETDASETDHSAKGDLFMERGICQVHTPSPLGADRDRLLSLINEIRTRKDNYAEQLSNLTLAHLSREQDSGEQSHQAIMANLLDGQRLGGQTPEKAPEGEELWQARLVLALAEILDREEAELAVQLSDIDNNELALFQELKGELDEEPEASEDPLAELMQIKARMGQPRPGTIKKRLQAWKTLYASGPLPEAFWLWTTCQEEAADLLISSYETQSGRITVPLLRLDLPAEMYMREADAMDLIQAFQKEAAALRKSITEKLTAIVSQGHLDLVDPIALLPDAGILARDWNEIVDYHFPEKRFGRQQLDLQFLANISFDTLLHNPSAPPQAGALCHGVLALCSNKQK